MNIYGLLKKTTIDTSKGHLMHEEEFKARFGQFINYRVIAMYGPVNVEGYINSECVYTARITGDTVKVL